MRFARFFVNCIITSPLSVTRVRSRICSSTKSKIMTELVRDTVFGHLLRLITHGKVLAYAEDKDPDLWKKYVHHEMTGRMAHHGHVGEETQEEKETRIDDQDSSQERSSCRAGSGADRNVLGDRIDPEKGRDVSMYA